MTEQLPEIFVDFNRRAAEPDTYVTWRNQFDGPVPLGARVHLTDYEDMQFEGQITGVSHDGRDVYVTVGAASASDHIERHLERREIRVLELAAQHVAVSAEVVGASA